MRISAVVPARAGSEGLPGKNVMRIAGRSLLERAIDFGLTLDLDDVLVTTDSPHYARIASAAGALVPGLRAPEASTSTAMEPAVIDDLTARLNQQGLAIPDVAVWLRPTFVFRSVTAVKECIAMVLDNNRSSARVVTEADPRLYKGSHGRLSPIFRDGGHSMVRRQGLDPYYSVFNVDVFRWPKGACPNDYLGNNIGYSVAPKLCNIDIDTAEDAEIAEALLHRFGDGILP